MRDDGSVRMYVYVLHMLQFVAWACACMHVCGACMHVRGCGALQRSMAAAWPHTCGSACLIAQQHASY